MGGTLRITKAEVLEVLNEKYVTTAYAKGLSKRTVLIKHVLRNALIIVTTLYSCQSVVDFRGCCHRKDLWTSGDGQSAP